LIEKVLQELLDEDFSWNQVRATVGTGGGWRRRRRRRR
jgi:hypothetical protein